MKTFKQIVAESFKLQENAVVDTLTAKDVPDWDSMNYLLFIAELEKEYGISFSMDEVLSADSLGSIRKSLQAKGITV